MNLDNILYAIRLNNFLFYCKREYKYFPCINCGEYFDEQSHGAASGDCMNGSFMFKFCFKPKETIK